jgi:transposase
MKFGEGLPEVTTAEWAKTPDSVKLLLAALLDRMAVLEARNAALESRNATLEARVRELEDRIRTNSSNSSKPPSSDGPTTPPRKDPPTGRLRGGQPGHPRHKRVLLPIEAVDELHAVMPSACAHCHGTLRGKDASPVRHQQVEVPEKLRHVTEWQVHTLTCSDCGKATTGQLPEGIPNVFGPRLNALTALLVGRFRLSHREVPELLHEVFGIDLSDGTVTDCVQTVSAALAEPVAQAVAAAQAAPIKNVDETGWRIDKKRAWLWVLVTAAAIVFVVRRSRSRKVAQELLGDAPGIVGSDRYAAYDYLPLSQRQLCWAHLIREWQRFVDRGGPDASVGTGMQGVTEKLFRIWKEFCQGVRSRSSFNQRVKGYQARVLHTLTWGFHNASPPTAGTCRAILDRFEALWTFTRRPGVEPTNNAAERAVRPAVLWRKGSFGSDTERGAVFTERILTTVATLRAHKRPVLPFLVGAVRAFLRQTLAPSLAAQAA